MWPVKKNGSINAQRFSSRLGGESEEELAAQVCVEENVK